MDVMKAQLPWLARSLADRCELVLSLRLLEDMQRMADYLAEHGISIGRAGAPRILRYAPEELMRSQLSSFLYGVRAQSANGILGDPTGAEAELGETWIAPMP